MTLNDLRINLGWNIQQLATAARVSFNSVKRAEAGERITAATAKAIADALSTAYGREIRPTDIEGLNIQ